MGAFNVSFLNPKIKAASKDYGFLVDQLQIKENQLAADGKLAPGDFDVLVRQAQELYSHPGLSQSQRSNLLVKISQYDEQKKTTSLKKANDISRVNNEVKDDFARNAMLFGNNPELLVRANLDATRMKIDQLSRSIDQLGLAGDDPSAHVNEYTETLNLFNDLSQALDDVKKSNVNDSGPSKSNYVAYVKTNSQGEIVDVEVGRTGSKTGYVETNGKYGGLQIYGKVNRKEFGKNYFVLGNTTFSGSDLTVQDPTTPGAFRSAPLLSEDTKGGRNFGVVPNVYKNVDLSQVRSQNGVRTGGWAEGANGFLYYKKPDGTFQKYVNAKRDQLGISDNDIIRLPKIMEQSILPNVNETIDGSKPFSPPISPSASPSTQSPTAPQAQTGAGPAPELGSSRTPSPTVRAPSSAGGIAQKALNVGKGILGYLFGGGE